MATTHQLPEWETSSTPAPARRSIASKFSFITSLRPARPQPAVVKKESINSTSLREEPVTGISSRRKLSDRRLPPWLACFGTVRMLLYCGIAALVLLILILGLAIGLSSKGGKGKSVNLPLPTKNGIYNGELTYYSPGPGYGACGFENTSQDAICALSHLVFDAMAIDSNPNHNPLCGKKIRITRFDPKQGRNNSVDVEVVDRCTGCKENDVDLSIKMFETLADEDQGRVVGTWAWL